MSILSRPLERLDACSARGALSPGELPCQRPNFLIIGAAKCATTTLCQMLSAHPQIFIAPGKETYFFTDERLFAKKGWSWYESLFVDGRNLPFRGEGTPFYSMRDEYPQVADRIAASLPDVKLIYMVRHPLRQIESWWMQARANGNTFAPPDFNRAIRDRFTWMVQPANYRRQLEPYLERFDQRQILVQFYEDFCSDPAAVLRRVLLFIGADGSRASEYAHLRTNISEGKRMLDPRFDELRQQPFVRTMKKLLPAGLKYYLIRKLFVRIPNTGRPNWDQETKAMVLDAIGESTRQFLSEQGRPQDYWELD